ncbi:MAG: histidine phosphatase family protein, partial [Clostridiales bacterium]|nr:histidine phosphatase family protein [Clostridiales bacterium]
MELYIMRHGETLWNKEGRIQGATDIDLTDFGRKLARLTGEGLARDGIVFDRIYT